MSENATQRPRARNTPGAPGRGDRLADAMRDCCTYTPPGHMEQAGWWTLCPAHSEADTVMRAVWPTIRDAVRSAPDSILVAALAAAGLADFNLLWDSADGVRRFADALDLLS